VLQIVPGRGHTYGTVTWAGSAVIAFSARALNEVSPPGTVAISPHQGVAAVTGRGEVHNTWFRDVAQQLGLGVDTAHLRFGGWLGSCWPSSGIGGRVAR
jgi:hypothetical protein